MRRALPAAVFAAVLLVPASAVLADTGPGGWGPGNGQVSATFSPAGKVTTLGVSSINVAWSCGTTAVPWTGPVSLNFTLVLTQPVSRTQSVQAAVSGNQPCTPGAPNTTIPAQMVPSQGMFGNGAATLQATVNGCDNTGLCDTENYVMTMKLQ